MLDLVIRDGEVVTPQGVGRWTDDRPSHLASSPCIRLRAIRGGGRGVRALAFKANDRCWAALINFTDSAKQRWIALGTRYARFLR